MVQDCTNRLGCELEQLPLSCLWQNYKAEIKGNGTFCDCTQVHQKPISQRSQAPETLVKADMGVSDSNVQPPCGTFPSLALICDFFLAFLWRLFVLLAGGQVRHTGQ